MKLIIAFSLVIALGSAASAHEAKSGWTYPMDCCGGYDCYQIEETDLAVVAGGWKVRATGETFLTAQVKQSPDGHFHRCSAGGVRTARTLCLFVPPMGS